ncbi:MAG: hypothetical protein LDLANPLL_02397 [Turneriella sp.]|nr:hypothetical protein [Turneriella sp.]
MLRLIKRPGIVALIAFFFYGCMQKEGVLTLQSFEPESSVSVPAMLDSIPHLKSLFNTVDFVEMDVRGRVPMTPTDIEEAVKSFMRLAVMTDKPIPELINRFSGNVRQLYLAYAGQQTSFEDAVKPIATLAKMNNSTLHRLALFGARLTALSANDATKYPGATALPFPATNVFADCSASNTSIGTLRSQVLNDASPANSPRKDLIETYVMLRAFACATQNSAKSLAADPGEALYNYFIADKADHDNPESDLLRAIADTQTNIAATKSSDEEIANWLAKKINLAVFTDTLATDGTAIMKNSAIYAPLRTIADLASGFIATENPANSKYLLADALDSLDTPIGKLPQIDTELGNALDLNNWKPFQFATGVLQKFRNTLIAYGGGSYATGRSKLMALVWDGGISQQYRMNYLAEPIVLVDPPGDVVSELPVALNPSANWCPGGVVYATFVPQVFLYDWQAAVDQSQCGIRDTAAPYFPQGLLKNGAESPQTGTGLAHFRAQANDILGNNDGNFANDVDPVTTSVGPGLNFRLSYDAETPTQSLIDNLILQLYSSYYDTASKSYSFTEREAIQLFNNPRRAMTNLAAQLQYSIRNLGVLDHAGREPWEAGFEAIPLLTGFIFSTAKPYIDPYFQDGNPQGFGKNPQSRLKIALRNTNAIFKDSHALADPANHGWALMGDDNDFMIVPIGGKNEVPAFCVGNDCATPHGSYRNIPRRNGIAWIPNLEMFTGELLTPGKFIPRPGGIPLDAEYYHQNWSGGTLTPQQGDVENALFNMGGMASSLIAMNAWQGHGPFSFKNRAPNGSVRKYKSTYYTDAYGSELRIRVRKFLSTGDETIYVAMGNNTGEHRGEILVSDELRCAFASAPAHYAFNDNVLQTTAGLDGPAWLIRPGGLTWQQYDVGLFALTNASVDFNYPVWRAGTDPVGVCGGVGTCQQRVCLDGNGTVVTQGPVDGSCGGIVPCGPLVCDPGGCYPRNTATGSDTRYGGRRNGPAKIEYYGDNYNRNSTLNLAVGANVGSGYVDSSLEINEKIYIPSPGGPCWSEASAGYGYARYGFIRPSAVSGYFDANNCGAWEAIQVDFDTREEAIQANMRWLLNEKKFTIVVPNAGADMTGVERSFSAQESSDATMSMAAWIVAQANGLLGLMHLRPVDSGMRTKKDHMKIERYRFYNGAWNFFSNQCPAGKTSCAPCDPTATVGSFLGHPVYQKCPFGTHNTGGFVDLHNAAATVSHENVPIPAGMRISNTAGLNEAGTDPDGHLTHRFERSSFEPGDSSFTVLFTAVKTGTVALFMDGNLVADSVLGTMGVLPMMSPLDLKTAEPLIALLSSSYRSIDIISSGYGASDASFEKFRLFYDRYLTTDDFGSDGTAGGDIVPDLWQQYQRSLTYVGCVEPSGRRANFCLTAADMPPIPRVEGVSYPSAFDAQGQVTAWSTHTNASDLKFGPLITALVIMVGTELDSRTPYTGTKNIPCNFSGGVTSQTLNPDANCGFLSTGADRDAAPIKGYLRRKYLSQSDVENNMPDFPLSILNETLLDLSTNNTPAYNPVALSNLLIESSPGARDGLLAKVGSSMYLHPQSLYHQLIENLNNRLEALLTNMGLIGGNPSTIEKLGFFVTKNVVGTGKPFGSNKLESLSGEPANLVREVLNLVRLITASPAGKDSFCNLIHGVGRMADELKISSLPDISHDNCLKLVALLHAQDSSAKYVVDEAILSLSVNLFYNGKIDVENMLQRISNATAAMKPAFDNLNTAVISIYGGNYDLRKIILYGNLIPEPYVDANANGKWDNAEPYLDFNGNEQHDMGANIDLRQILGTGSYPDLVTDQMQTYGNATVSAYLPDFMTSNAGLSGIDVKQILNNILLFGKTSGLEAAPPALTASDITKALDKIDEYTDGDWYGHLIGVEVAKALDAPDKVLEPTLRDFNRNGRIDAGEFSDYNGNSTRDRTSVRQYFSGLAADYHAGVVDRAASGSLNQSLLLVEGALSPRCLSYTTYPTCTATNAEYMTPALMTAISDIYTDPEINPTNMLAAKTLLGSLFYSKDLGSYTYLNTNLKEGMLPIQEINKGSRLYAQRQNIEGFAPKGSLRYLVNNISNSQNYRQWLFAEDTYGLFNQRAFREYQKAETLWATVSGLLTDFSKKAYSQTGQNFSLGDDYFSRFRGIFR